MHEWLPLLWQALFVLFGLLMLAAGLVLVRMGLWPRRQGTDLHCSHCQYNLTGLQEGLCPECGKPWTAETAITGYRHRRPTRVIGGSLVLTAACLWFLMPVADRIAGFNYFSLLPTRVVLLFVNSSDPQTAQKAIDEMAARLVAGTVPADQAEMFLRGLTSHDLKVRDRVIEGQAVPFMVEHTLPQVKGVSLTSGVARLEIDGQATTQHFGTGTSSLGYSANQGAIGSYITPCPAVGQHAVRVSYRLRFTWTSPGSVLGVCEYKVPLQGEFEIIPADSQDTVTKVPAPGLKEQLQRSIEVTQCEIEPGRGQYPRISIMLNAHQSPMNMAFDVFVRVQGREYPLSGATFRKDKNYGSNVMGDYKGPATQAVDVILRSSAKIARRTVDLVEIWEGELVYPNVPLKGTFQFPPASQPVGAEDTEL